jgi:hypothetical protein
VTQVVGDKHAHGYSIADYASHGLEYVVSTRTKSDIYKECLALLSAGRVRLPDLPMLESQLLNLERRPGASGRDTIDHPKTVGAKDDLANAVCGSILAALDQAQATLAENQQRLTPHEEAQLRAFEASYGGPPVPPGGYGNLALDDDGEPVDTRYRGDVFSDFGRGW